jgi:hypothetical protein
MTQTLYAHINKRNKKKTMSVLTKRGDKPEKLIKITPQLIYTDIFTLSQMLFQGSWK